MFSECAKRKREKPRFLNHLKTSSARRVVEIGHVSVSSFVGVVVNGTEKSYKEEEEKAQK